MITIWRAARTYAGQRRRAARFVAGGDGRRLVRPTLSRLAATERRSRRLPNRQLRAPSATQRRRRDDVVVVVFYVCAPAANAFRRRYGDVRIFWLLVARYRASVTRRRRCARVYVPACVRAYVCVVCNVDAHGLKEWCRRPGEKLHGLRPNDRLIRAIREQPNTNMADGTKRRVTAASRRLSIAGRRYRPTSSWAYVMRRTLKRWKARNGMYR